MASDYHIDPATGDIDYRDGDIVLTDGIENALYLAIAIEKGTYWADPDLGSDVQALIRNGEPWPVIVDAARRELDLLQRRGVLTVLDVAYDADARELVIAVEERAEPYRIGVQP